MLPTRSFEAWWKQQLAGIVEACNAGRSEGCADVEFARRFHCGTAPIPPRSTVAGTSRPTRSERGSKGLLTWASSGDPPRRHRWYIFGPR